MEEGGRSEEGKGPGPELWVDSALKDQGDGRTQQRTERPGVEVREAGEGAGWRLGERRLRRREWPVASGGDGWLRWVSLEN